jgi:hypothetical protein
MAGAIKRRAAAFLSAAFLTAAVAHAAAQAAAIQGAPHDVELPIKRVVLYKHGLGYFEREGEVDGTGNLNLRFSSGQMNDVLKTLTALDLGGGRISTIGYDSQAPATRLLAEFGFDLPREGALIALLELFRGARVEARLATRSIAGSVVGVETRDAPSGERGVAKVARVTLLCEDGSAQSFDAVEIESLRFLDKELAADVQRYLEVLRDTYRAERKSMQLRLDGDGTRPLFVSYAVEVPIWKASYRLVLRTAAAKPTLLQGWAIVDNTGDEDWNDVELSLVAGLPVSFIQDLYTPLYSRRPVVQMQQELAVAPQTHEGGYAAGDDEKNDGERGRANERRKALADAPPPGSPGAAGPGTPTGGSAGFLSGRARGASKDAALDELARSGKTWTRELGTLFEYRIDHPVTVKRNRSALLPIVGAEVEAVKVALYNPAMREKNPLSAVRFKNTSGLTLEGGPVTVLDDETYAGEALIETLEPGQERYLSYAVDLAVTIDTKQESREERVTRTRLVNGVLFLDARHVASTVYALRDGDQKGRKVVIEHARRPGYSLDAGMKPLEETAEHWRFEVDVAAGAAQRFEVRESFPVQSQFAVANLGPDDVVALAQRGVVNDAMVKALREAIEARAAIAELERTVAGHAAEIGAIASDQERLRKNLGALGSTSEEQKLRGRYVDALQKGEDRLAELGAAKKKLDEEIARRRAALDSQLRALALEQER